MNSAARIFAPPRPSGKTSTEIPHLRQRHHNARSADASSVDEQAPMTHRVAAC
jgi:hypothetical protein